MNNHIIIGTGRRCLCGMFEGKPLGCSDIIKSIETIKRHGQSWDGGLLARLMETLIVDVDKPQTREEIDDQIRALVNQKIELDKASDLKPSNRTS